MKNTSGNIRSLNGNHGDDVAQDSLTTRAWPTVFYVYGLAGVSTLCVGLSVQQEADLIVVYSVSARSPTRSRLFSFRLDVSVRNPAALRAPGPGQLGVGGADQGRRGGPGGHCVQVLWILGSPASTAAAAPHRADGGGCAANRRAAGAGGGGAPAADGATETAAGCRVDPGGPTEPQR